MKRSLLVLAIAAIASCTTFTGTFTPDAEDDGKLPGGFGPGTPGKDAGPTDGTAPPACAEAVCWTILDAPLAAPAIEAPVCNPAGLGGACPGGFGCSAAPITVPAQGHVAAHPALACTAAQPGAAAVIVEVAPAQSADPDALPVTLDVRLAGAPLPGTAGDMGELLLASRVTGRVFRTALGQTGEELSLALPAGLYDARLSFGERQPAQAPPLPVRGLLEVREAGSATIDVPVVANTIRILVDRGTIEPSRLGGSRGVLVVRSAAGDEARVALPVDGAGDGISVVLVPGPYDLSYDASAAEALLVPRQHVPLGAGIAIDGTPLELELETATMFVSATVDGAPAPEGSTIVLDTGEEPARTFSLSDGGTLMFAVPTDVILEVAPGGEVPFGSTRLAEGHVPVNDETLAVDVETTPLVGELTVDGAPLADLLAGTAGRIELRATGRSPSSVPLLVNASKFGGPVYRDRGELWYVPGTPLSPARPMQEVRLATDFDPTGEDGTFDIETVQATVRVLLAGAEPPEAPAQGVRGTLTLRPVDDQGIGPLSAALPASGEAIVTVPVAVGTYDVLVHLLPGDPTQPAMPGVTGSGESFTADRELLADARPATLEATLVEAGQPFEATPIAGGRGALRFVSARGEQVDVTLESVGEARATARLYEGAWSIYYLCEGACMGSLAPEWPAPLVEGVGVSGP